MKISGLILFVITCGFNILTAQDISKKELARNIDAAKIYKETDPGKKEKTYLSWLKKYPPAYFKNSPALYEYIKIELSASFIRAGKVQKGLNYANQLKPGHWRGEGRAETAAALFESGYLNEAASFYKKAIDDTRFYLVREKDSTVKAADSLHLTSYSFSLAQILFKQNHPAEARIYGAYSYQHNIEDLQEITLLYADILLANRQYATAFNVLEKEMKTGRPINEVRTRLREAFNMTRDTTGWRQYISGLNELIHHKRKDALRKEMINIPAPAFTLYDLDGNIVSLSDYKGKIVVIDFWATWCIPCRQSFPFMQKAVNKFGDSNAVHFLFIHTWEKENHAVKAARDFIKKYNYRFHVLMDLKDPVTEVNNTVFDYQVGALPAKFLVDKKGMIRFKIEPMLGNEEYALDELGIMIELAQE